MLSTHGCCVSSQQPLWGQWGGGRWTRADGSLISGKEAGSGYRAALGVKGEEQEEKSLT